MHWCIFAVVHNKYVNVLGGCYIECAHNVPNNDANQRCVNVQRRWVFHVQTYFFKSSHNWYDITLAYTYFLINVLNKGLAMIVSIKQ